MKKLFYLSAIVMTLAACTSSNSDNPLLLPADNPYDVPAFDKIKVCHYRPAFDKAIADYRAEIDAIVSQPDAATFQNTIAALDRSGLLLSRVEGVFFNLLETDGNDEMNALAEEISPLLSECSDDIVLNEALFTRVKEVYEGREAAGLTSEQMRLTEETYRNFVMNGANLNAEQKERLREINKQLSQQGEQSTKIVLDDIKQKKDEYITLTGSTRNKVEVNIADLMYIESVGNYAKVCHREGNEFRSEMIRATSKQMEETPWQR